MSALPMGNNLLLKVNGFSVTYHTNQGKFTAVDKLSLEVKKGEAVAVVGESGCGKSSLALGLMGLLKGKKVSVEGEINFDGQNLVELSERKLQAIRGRRIAMVFQDPMTSLNPYLKVGLQVSEQIFRHLRCGSRKARQHAIDMLESVGLNDAASRVNHYPHEFSGGMRQRVMLAAALSCAPDLLIADEPTTALDVTIQAQILNLIRNEVEKGHRSLLLITHDLGVVAGLCHRVLVMYAGKIVEEGHVDSIYAHPRHPYTHALLKAIPRIDGNKSSKMTPIDGQPPDMTNFKEDGCIFSPRCTFATDRCEKEIPELRVKDDQKGYYRCHYPLSLDLTDSQDNIIPKDKSLSTESDTVNHLALTTKNENCIPGNSKISPKTEKKALLTVKELVVQYDSSKAFGSRSSARSIKAVNEVSLRLYEGEILGLAGESGCGKSTLVRAIAKLVQPRRGSIIFDDEDITHIRGNPLRKIRRNIQLIFQDPYSSLNPRLKAWQLIAEPLINFNLVKGGELKSEAKRLMELVGLDSFWAGRYPHEFSGGQRQRIGIARALAQEPKVILCDEPVSALDVSIQAQILNLLKKLQRQFSLSLIFISHDLGVIRQISDRVAIMYMGRIVESADVNCIYSSPRHPYTRSLINAIPIPDPRRERQGADPVFGNNVLGNYRGSGCDFSFRCPWVNQKCYETDPTLKNHGDNHHVACFNWQEHQSELCIQL